MAVQGSTFLDPLWRRLALVAFCAAWCAFELYNGATGWAAVAGGMTAYGTWLYLIEYKPSAAPAKDEEPR
ncbi:MAG: DUF3329 domain-containing protein [Rhizobiaceae bacterium]